MGSMIVDSIKLHQELVDAIVQTADPDGISRLSQKELGERIGRSQTWVTKAISRLNTEELCIIHSDSGYSVKFTNLLQNGIFRTIMGMIVRISENPEMIEMSQSEQAKTFGVSIKTVQMMKGYLVNELGGDN